MLPGREKVWGGARVCGVEKSGGSQKARDPPSLIGFPELGTPITNPWEALLCAQGCPYRGIALTSDVLDVNSLLSAVARWVCLFCYHIDMSFTHLFIFIFVNY